MRSKAWLFAVLSLVMAIAIASLVPRGVLPTFGKWGPLLHGLAYCVLGLLVGFNVQKRRLAILLGIAILALSFGFEAFQAFVPGRSPGALDALGNVLGLTLGLLLSFRCRANLGK